MRAYLRPAHPTIPVGTLLAKFFVTPSTDLTFVAATGGIDGFGFSTPGGSHTADPCSFTTAAVPEPWTIALLACGLFGLLAYAWRKRK